MFIGWLRKNSFKTDIDEFAKKITIDVNLVLKTVEENLNLCFGAYDNDKKLVAFITGYQFQNTVLINNFYYLDDVSSDVKKRLIKLLLDNNYDLKNTILFMAKNQTELPIFKRFKFKEYAKFKKAVFSGGGAAFNFSNVTAKSISNENFLPTIHKLDSEAFDDDRFEYITKNVMKQSSLVLSTQFGYQHSYAIDKSLVKISPWIMVDEAFTDAEKLIRGVIYHRGLKRLFAFIPKDVKEITELYEKYGFKLVDDFTLIYLNDKPNINLESLYGF